MKFILKIFKYELNNVIRSRWVIFYSIFFLAVSYALFSFTGDSSKAILSLMDITIIIIPLVSVIFGTIYLYNSREFIEMMLCQPIDRRSLFFGVYLGTAFPLAGAFALGTILPFIFFGSLNQLGLLLLLLIIGVTLTFIFLSISFLISVRNDDKVKGLGFSILVWLFLSIIYDGIILFITYYFQDYPLEKPVLFLSLLNPVDLGRIIFLLKFDISALMGYTGAVFQKFFGTDSGTGISSLFLILWIFVPLFLSLYSFKRKDF